MCEKDTHLVKSPLTALAMQQTCWIIDRTVSRLISDPELLLSGRNPDSYSSEPGFESPSATVSKIGHFRSLH